MFFAGFILGAIVGATLGFLGAALLEGVRPDAE